MSTAVHKVKDTQGGGKKGKKDRKKGRKKERRFQSNVYCLAKTFFVKYTLHMKDTSKYSSPHREAMGDFYFLFILLCIFPGFCNKFVLIL